MDVFPVLFLLGSLVLCGRVEAQSTINELREAALQWEGTFNCKSQDCDCAFNVQRGCCCGANELFQLEDDTFSRIKYLWHDIVAMKSQVEALAGGLKIAFKATITKNGTCLGAYNTDVPIPYSNVQLNDGNGYNPSLGVFTAPLDGVYVFSYTVYSSEQTRLYYHVQLFKNEESMVSVWEDNREDLEDSASQILLLELKKGDNVYMKLRSGRRLCNAMDYNTFTGYMLYPLNV